MLGICSWSFFFYQYAFCKAVAPWGWHRDAGTTADQPLVMGRWSLPFFHLLGIVWEHKSHPEAQFPGNLGNAGFKSWIEWGQNGHGNTQSKNLLNLLSDTMHFLLTYGTSFSDPLLLDASFLAHFTAPFVLLSVKVEITSTLTPDFPFFPPYPLHTPWFQILFLCIFISLWLNSVTPG